MKIFTRVLFAVLASAMLFASCKKSDPDVAPYGKLQLSFSNEAGGQPVSFGPLIYKNAAGNTYSIDLLKYYVTNVTLIKSDNTEHNFHNYNLIDGSQAASQSFTLDSVQSSEYAALKFYLGVDYERNHTGVQEGALDPVNGMIWAWKTGYIFFKHEGFYLDSAGNRQPLLFHYGTDKALVTVTLPLNKLSIAGNTRKLNITLNLDSLYGTPNAIDFNVDNNHMSTVADDLFWINAMSVNFKHAFQISKTE